MTTIRVVIHDRRIDAPAPDDLPDGTEVVLTVARGDGVACGTLPHPLADIEFMTEEQQSDDPAAIQQWIAELRATPPMPEDPMTENDRRAWEEKWRRYNVEAVRGQFETRGPDVF